MEDQQKTLDPKLLDKALEMGRHVAKKAHAQRQRIEDCKRADIEKLRGQQPHPTTQNPPWSGPSSGKKKYKHKHK